MSVTTNSLRELHELHQRISRLREQLDRGPRQLEAKRKHLAQRNEALEKARADLKTAKVKSHEKETERKSFDNRINQLQLQINTAKSNKEYSTLMSEKDTATKARAAVEDQVLEFLMQEEEKTQEIQITESEVKRLQQELADLEKSTNQQGSEFGGKLAEAESQLVTVEASLPADIRDVYRRLLERRGPDALAPAAGGTCTGCYTGITPQMQNQLLMNELLLCKSCGRILYLADDPQPDDSSSN
jgi:predicted  nucleic acid-binding Zn-ribbon protein